MKTKLILAAVVLMAITYSCTERDEEQKISSEETKISNKKIDNKEIWDNTSSSYNKGEVSDSIKTGPLLNGTQIIPKSEDDGETVNPGQLGTPPTRP
ncbi:hypothetical protein [Chryseobacterium vrystaatense]|uniref:Lipoprotein n=1 Tax=Chryseobacterium vrystaatense TaxID=307480 RepID=A0ABR4UP69_9FLAO|nr:hypothetical protein [Chryseobacterium vrystaatense]KFF26860.1 hypothetical protein IW16_06160 [Chryseobacterium vrystaatense]